MKIYVPIRHKLDLTQFRPKVVSWRFEITTDVIFSLGFLAPAFPCGVRDSAELYTRPRRSNECAFSNTFETCNYLTPFHRKKLAVRLLLVFYLAILCIGCFFREALRIYFAMAAI